MVSSQHRRGLLMEKNFVEAKMIELSHEDLASVSGGSTDGGSAIDSFTVQTETATVTHVHKKR